jgi:prepilin-type processing-associated H-X9-DG protein
MAYIGVSPSNGVRKKHTYTATASQTSFSGAGDEGITLAYRDSNYVDVYQNGVKLADEDYTATSGTAIVLAQGASADDIVEIIAFDVFSVADTVSKADGGTFDGNVTMAGTLDVTGETTISNHLNMGDTDSIKLGAGADLTLISDGANGTIAAPNGTLTLDVAGDITLDAGGQNIRFSDDGTEFGQIYQQSNHLNIYSSINNADLKIQGNNGGAVITAIELDMSDAGSAYFNNRIYVPVSIVHTGDTNTSIDFDTDIIDLYTGGSLGLRVSNSTVTVNESGADKNFRVESNGNANMLFVDGGNNRVGIGTATPLSKLDVTGGFITVSKDANTAGRVGASEYITGSTANDLIVQATGSTITRFYQSGVNSLNIDGTGTVTMPLQPAFYVETSSTQTNFAVSSTHTLAFGTERFDQNADFASNVFTAPVTGKYFFNTTLRIESIDTGASYYLWGFDTSNHDYVSIIDPNFSADVSYISVSQNVVADMDAGDTAKVIFQQAGGTQQTDLQGASGYSYFCGHLVA